MVGGGDEGGSAWRWRWKKKKVEVERSPENPNNSIPSCCLSYLFPDVQACDFSG